jgi:magnesium transporter
VVSIHAGGGGVDVNTWQADDDDDIDNNTEGLPGSCDEEEALIGIDDENALEDSMLLRGRGPASDATAPARRSSSIRIDRPTVSPELRASALSRQATESLSPGTSRRRRRTATFLAPLGDLNRSSQGGGTIPPPLSPTLSTGLSIGLSPMSPGFAPVPLERRRRVSGMSMTDVVDEIQRRRHSRRSISAEGTGADSPVHHRSSTATTEGDEAAAGVTSAVDSAEEGDEARDFGNERGGDGPAATAARFRWKWLKRALRK